MPRSYGTTNLAPYASAPAVGNAGDAYYNTGQKVLYLSDGTAWNASGGGAAAGPAYAEIQSTPPTAATPPAIVPPMGLLWVDTSVANPTTFNVPYFPPQTPPVSGFNQFIDGSGQVWVSRNGSAWKRAVEALFARVYRNAAWTAPTAKTTVPFDTAQWDPMAMFVAPGFTVPLAGYYDVKLNVAFPIGAAGSQIIITINVNGSDTTQLAQVAGASSNYFPHTDDQIYVSSAGQVVLGMELCTVAAGVYTGPVNTWMAIQYLHP